LTNTAGTSLKIDNKDNKNSNLINDFKKEGIDLREDNAQFTLENQSNYYIFENEFIDQSTSLLDMILKYSQKEYKEISKIYFPDDGTFKMVQAQAHDENKYKEIIEHNIMDGEERNFSISVNVLYEILNDSNKSRMFLDILILFALATKSRFYAKELRFEFKVEDNCYEKELNIVNPESIHLYPLYNWIINDEEYEEPYNVKLHIVRQVIVNKKKISDAEGILEDSKLAYKRIISKKTNDYFDQLNQLKDDFLILSNNVYLSTEISPIF